MAASEEAVQKAVDVLSNGGIVGFPTETVYGVGALASDGEAVSRIFELKGRPKTRALIVHLHDVSGLDAYAAEVPEYAKKLADAFWPGPLTLVLKRRPEVIDEVTGGGDTVGVRVPDHPDALRMLAALAEARPGQGSGVAAPSANRFGEPPATSAEEVTVNLGAAGEAGGPDFVLDGGPCPGRVPSTILSCVGDNPRLLRRGAIELEKIEELIGLYIDQ